jgi:hypothetical protein
LEVDRDEDIKSVKIAARMFDHEYPSGKETLTLGRNGRKELLRINLKWRLQRKW